jgi:hypothetical protein
MDQSNIKYEALLPLQWQPTDIPPDSDTQWHVRENNLECLKQALLLDEFSPVSHDDLASDPRDSARIEKKVDLLLSLVGSMIQNQQNTQKYQVVLAADSLQWKANDLSDLHAQQLIVFQLYLHPYSVAALTLYGEVREAQAGYCGVNIRYMDSIVQELLQKYIFLNHRRQVAAKKHTTRPV